MTTKGSEFWKATLASLPGVLGHSCGTCNTAILMGFFVNTKETVEGGGEFSVNCKILHEISKDPLFSSK